MIAAWCPPWTAVSMAATATTVLPTPTSPWSRRCIGWGPARSAVISAMASRWPSVSSKGRPSTNRPTSTPRRVVADAAGGALVGLLAQHQRQLDPQQLVEHQPLAGDGVLLGATPAGGCPVKAAVRSTRSKRSRTASGTGSRKSTVRRSASATQPAEVAGVEAELVGLRVDGRDLEPVGLVEQVDLGVRHLLLAPEGRDLAEEHRLGALGELAGAATAG